jgi:hypothetical protein
MAKQRIHAKGTYQQEEAVAASAITPGMLVEFFGKAGTLQPHSTEGGQAPEAAFAVEDALQGKTVSDAYAAGDVVTYILPSKGSCVNAILKDGYDYSIGMQLISAGDGKLIPNGQESSATFGADVVAICTENLDLAPSAGVDTLSEVRIV